MGPGQRATLKQGIQRAMKDEEVNKVTKKKFNRKRIKLCSAIRAFALAHVPSIFLSPLAFFPSESQKLFQFDQLNGAEYGLSLYVFVIKLRSTRRYVES